MYDNLYIMRKRVRKIAHAGTFGSDRNPQSVSEKDLKEMAESFSFVKAAPVTLGHDFSALSPRLGEVTSLSFRDGALYAAINESDALARAVDEGYYPDCSLGAARSAADGRMYLHHLAYLGEEPPAIKDLRSAVKTSLGIAASDNQNLITFPKERLMLSDKGEEMEEEEKKKLASLEEAVKRLEEKLEAKKSEQEERKEGSADALSELEELKKQLQAWKEKYPEDELALSDAAACAVLEAVREERRMRLKDECAARLTPVMSGAALALSDFLPLNARVKVGEKEEVSAHEAFRRIVSCVRESALTHRVALSDGGAKADDDCGEDPRAMLSCI